jgi:hypothetical protein
MNRRTVFWPPSILLQSSGMGLYAHSPDKGFKKAGNFSVHEEAWHLVIVTGAKRQAASSSFGISTFYSAIEGADSVKEIGQSNRIIKDGMEFSSIGFPGIFFLLTAPCSIYPYTGNF